MEEEEDVTGEDTREEQTRHQKDLNWKEVQVFEKRIIMTGLKNKLKQSCHVVRTNLHPY